MIQDELRALNSAASVRTAYSTISHLQDQPKAYQVAAMAIAFHAICEALGLDKRDELERTSRILADCAEKNITTMTAFRNYLTDFVAKGD